MKYILSIISILLVTFANAQELNCQVNVVSDPALDITTTEKEIFKDLEQSIFELMNNTAWTKDEYAVEERINCVFQISITKVVGTGAYEATLQVQATRPV